MTVSQQIPVSNCWGNNSAREFPFNFFIEKESELLVEHTNLNGVKSILENGVDYSIHEVGNKEGSYITFPLADSRYNTLAWDTSSDKKELLTISLNLPIEQSAEFENSGDLSKKNLELSFDYAIRLIQILSRRIYRAVKVKEGDEATPDQLIESLNDSKRVATEAANLATSKAEESLNNANTAKEKADIATAKTQEVTETYNNAMADIQKDWQDAIDGIAEKQTQAETSITALKTSAKLTITNGMADITANKEQSMSAIDENRETSLAEIESAKSSAVSSVNETKNNSVTTVKQTGDEEYNKIISTGIDAKANSDLSNLTEAGEKHFLNKSQITNCLLEAPNGVATYSGNVVTVPTGVKALVNSGVTNADGTIKNVEVTTLEAQTINVSTTGIIYLGLDGTLNTTSGAPLVSVVYGTSSISAIYPYSPVELLKKSDIEEITKTSRNPIGQPQITLSNTLEDNEIWLEGATVSRTTYAELFKIYGTTYGTGDGSTTFVLPNFKNRTIWGYDEFGYIKAGLPNITGITSDVIYSKTWQYADGAFKDSFRVGDYWDSNAGSSYQGDRYKIYFDASDSNPIYGNSDTVQPPAIKVRVKTRYK